jgi:hypothetical protein
VKRLVFILFALLVVTAFTFAVPATHPPGNDFAEAVFIGEAVVVYPEAVLVKVEIAALSSNTALPANTINNQTRLPENLMTNAVDYRIIKPGPVIGGAFLAPDYYLIL